MSNIAGFLKRHPTTAVGGGLLLLLFLMAVCAPWLGTVDPTALSPIHRTRAPSEQFWFGTDLLGRDVYSRVIYGARVSLIVGFTVAALSTVIGVVIGLAAGFVRWVDAVVMRIMDGFMSIPTILLAIALIALTRASLQNVIIAITIAEVPRVVRLVRGLVLSLREQPYVEAAVRGRQPPAHRRAAYLPQHAGRPDGAGHLHLRRGHPGRGQPVVHRRGRAAVGAVVGNIMAEGRALWQIKPHLIAFPAVFLSITILAINMLGDGLRDAVDPRMAKRI